MRRIKLEPEAVASIDILLQDIKDLEQKHLERLVILRGSIWAIIRRGHPEITVETETWHLKDDCSEVYCYGDAHKEDTPPAGPKGVK